MAQHQRYADREKNERAIIQFVREDLLLRGQIGDITVPLSHDSKLIGPTILDVLVRVEDGPDSYWRLREPDEFIAHGDAEKRRARDAGHPFRPGLVSGGDFVSDDGDFVRVTKLSSVSIGAYAFRLAVGALGSIAEVHRVIGAKAAAAWARDLERSRELYEAVKAAPDGRLIETVDIEDLRPGGSVSDAIETDILRDACMLLGVDPDLTIKRRTGRPRKAEGSGETETGDFISVTVRDGVVSARMTAELAGIPAHTDLGELPVLKLVALLRTLRDGGASTDAELLEAFMDAAAPDWRDVGATPAEDGGTTDDPYTVLGVARGMPLDEITRVYRRAMQAMHPDRGACPAWFAQTASVAYRKIKEELGGSGA